MEKLARIHYNIAIITTLVIGAVLYALTPNVYTQIVILLSFAGFIGIPHGLTDFKILKNVSARIGIPGGTHIKAITGALIYTLTAVSFIILWSALPLIALLIFLILSVWHFGEQDIEAHNINSRLKSLHIIARGTSIITLPYIMHPETADYFNLLISKDYFQPIIVNNHKIAISVIISLYVAFELLTFNLRYILETILLLIMLAILPPLVSFTLYFCFFHTPRHYISTVNLNNRILVPAIIIAIVLGAFIFIGLTFNNQQLISINTHYIAYFFKLLAALTFSHVLFNYAAQRKHDNSNL